MGKRIVAIVVGVLVAGALGVGGVMVASRSGDAAPATLPALDLATPAAGTAQSAERALGSGSADGAASKAAPASGIQYKLSGPLPELPRSARAWTLDQQVTGAQAAALAGKLGLSGEPRRSGSSWIVGDGDRQLFVNAKAGGPWTFSNAKLTCSGPVPAIKPNGRARPPFTACPVAGVRTLPVPVPDSAGSAPATGSVPGTGATAATGSVPGTGATSSPATPVKPLPVPPGRLRPPAPVVLPDRATAERVARDLFARVGAPAGDAEVSLVQAFDRWSVTASPRVGGRPTVGLIWTAGIGAKGEVLSATGWLDAPTAGDDYPLITVQEALKRLRERQVGGPIVQSGTAAPGGLPCERLQRPGGCGPAMPLTLEVTGVRLGLQLATVLAQPGGGRQVSYLVPAYLFQINGSWERQASVIAVQDRFITTTPPPTAVPLRPGG